MPSCPTAPRAVASRARVPVKPAIYSATPSEAHADVGEPRRGSATHLIFAPVEVAGFLRLEGSARHDVARGRETAARALLSERAARGRSSAPSSTYLEPSTVSDTVNRRSSRFVWRVVIDANAKAMGPLREN